MTPLPPLDPPALADALVHVRDHAHELAERLAALWMDSAETEADQLFPLVDSAALLAATVDVVQQRMTGQPMITNIGKRIEQSRRERGPGLA